MKVGAPLLRNINHHKISPKTCVFPLSGSRRHESSSSRIHSSPYGQPKQREVDYTASSKLLADAAREEAEDVDAERRHGTKKQHPLLTQEENWTGEESMQDAVLRMLVDKYKPLRGPAVRSADEKLKQASPIVSTHLQGQPPPRHISRAEEPLLPTVEGHKTWLVTFKAPSHAINVKVGNVASPPLNNSVSRKAPGLEDPEKKPERGAKKRSEHAQRLGRARESMLDYRMGIKSATKGNAEAGQRRPVPVNLRGWNSLVEERIERARQEGQFRSLNGRGKPLIRETDEHNPFIAREEFLMNRIVQRNAAAPPWVEMQRELEEAVVSFRTVLRQSWTRRAIRMLTLDQLHAHARLSALTLSDVRALRDSEWEAREREYHESALEEVNFLVRRYNGVAPYTVRRPYHERQAELARAYAEGGGGILRGVEERLKNVGADRLGSATGHQDEGDDGPRSGVRMGSGTSGTSSESPGGSRVGLWDVIRGWFTRV